MRGRQMALGGQAVAGILEGGVVHPQGFGGAVIRAAKASGEPEIWSTIAAAASLADLTAAARIK